MVVLDVHSYLNYILQRNIDYRRSDWDLQYILISTLSLILILLNAFTVTIIRDSRNFLYSMNFLYGTMYIKDYLSDWHLRIGDYLFHMGYMTVYFRMIAGLAFRS